MWIFWHLDNFINKTSFPPFMGVVVPWVAESPFAMEAYSFRLSENGGGIDFIEDCRTALERLPNLNPGLVIVDVMLPTGHYDRDGQGIDKTLVGIVGSLPNTGVGLAEAIRRARTDMKLMITGMLPPGLYGQGLAALV